MKNNLKHGTVIWGIIIIGVTVGFILFLLLGDTFKSKRDFNEMIEYIKNPQDIASVVITDPVVKTELLPESREVRITDNYDSLLQKISNAFEQYTYKGSEESSEGNWDIRVRIEGKDGLYTFYLGEDKAYIFSNMTKYYFAPKDKDKYFELYSFVAACFEEK